MSHERNPHSPVTSVSQRSALTVVIVVLVVFIVMGVTGILERMHAETLLAQRTDLEAPPTVSVALPMLGAPNDSLTLPGNVTAYSDAPIYARTDGYLVHWYYDIGAHVKKGALLAVIATPELDQQLQQAEHDLVSAEANATTARIEAKRYSQLVKDQAVSQQDTETYINQEASTAATVRSAQANVQRLKELQAFEKVYAPFTGVITARDVDTGQLINNGTSSELFHMESLQTLRVYTNVPQAYAPDVTVGMKIPLTFLERPGRAYTGTLVRTADAVDPVSRTLLIEVDVNNHNGELLPGSMAEVHIKAPGGAQSYIVPAAAVIFPHEGPRVATVVDSTIHLAPVTIGLDDGAHIEILSGLKPSDLVIQDTPSSLIDGEKVTVVSSPVAPAPPPAEAAMGKSKNEGGQ